VQGFEQKAYILEDVTSVFVIAEQDGVFEVLRSAAAGSGKGQMRVAQLGTLT